MGSKPIKVALEKDKTYSFCACGKTQNEPYCDGSHKGSGMKPNVVTADADKTISICCCQHSQMKPYCDGSHKMVSHCCKCC